MACIPYMTWLNANAACKAKSAGIDVRGLGQNYVRTGMRGLRGMGDNNINTTPVYNDPNDPCFIATQTPCAPGSPCPIVCPTGYHSMSMLAAPGQPALCNCAKDKVPTAPSASAAPSNGSATAPSSIPGGTPITTASAAGGFSHWGLLAALAVGGGALYLVMKKKGSS